MTLRELLEALLWQDAGMTIMPGTFERAENAEVLEQAIVLLGLEGRLHLFARGLEWRVVGSDEDVDALAACLVTGGAEERDPGLVCDWTDEGEA